MPVDSATIRAEEGVADPTVLLETIALITDARWITWLNGHLKKGARKLKPIELRTRPREKRRLTMQNVMRAFGFAPPLEANDPDWRPPPPKE